LLATLITDGSDAVEKLCRRDFVARSYDELYSGNGEPPLFLQQYPIISVESVRYRPVTVLKIQNTDQATNQQARGAVTSTGLSLMRVASGESTTDSSVHSGKGSCPRCRPRLGRKEVCGVGNRFGGS